MALYSLLVGINEYKKKELPLLFGPVKDVARISAYLSDNFTPADLHMLSLLNSTATKAAIVDGFNKHLSRAGIDDQVLFYFSGHGALEEPGDSFKKIGIVTPFETLVCYDSLCEATTLADKEIRYLLRQLSINGPAITVIFDCCHSGGASRAPVRNGDMIIKRLADKVEARSWNDLIFSNTIRKEDLNETTSLEKILPQGEHIQIAACQSNQSAWEVRGSGLLTSNLLQVLQQAMGNVSYNDLYSRVKYLMANRFDQVPNLFINAADKLTYGRRIFLGMVNTATVAGNANVVFNKPTGQWILDKGAIHGVTEIRPDFDLELKIAPGQPAVTTARITAIFPDHCVLQLKEPPTDNRSFFTNVRGLYQKELAVYLTGDMSGNKTLLDFYETHQDVFAALGLKFVKDILLADYVVMAYDDGYYFLRPDQSQEPRELQPLLKVIKGYSEESANAIVDQMKSIARFEFIKSLQNPHAAVEDFPIDCKIRAYNTDNNTTLLIPDAAGKIKSSYRADETDGRKTGVLNTKIELFNKAESGYYCAVVLLGVDFSIDPFLMADETSYVAVKSAVELQDGELIGFLQEEYTKDGNQPSEIISFLIIASTEKFEIGSIQQKGMELPELNKKLATPKGAFRSDAPEKMPPSWCTKLITLELLNPYYQH